MIDLMMIGMAALTPLMGQAAVAQPVATTVAEGRDQECRRLSDTGTRITPLVCATKAQWAVVDRAVNDRIYRGERR